MIQMPLRKIMRSSVPPAILVLILLSALCLTAACTIPFLGDAGSSDKRIDVGIGTINRSVEKSYLNMSMAQAMLLTEFIPGSELDRGTIPIYYIQGVDLDSSGNAARWTFAVNRSTGLMLMVLENNDLTEIPWTGGFSDTPIHTDQIISPEELFSKNHDLIFSNPSVTVSEQSELDLRDGIYTLTLVSHGSMRYLVFDAVTGQPVVLQ